MYTHLYEHLIVAACMGTNVCPPQPMYISGKPQVHMLQLCIIVWESAKQFKPNTQITVYL